GHVLRGQRPRPRRKGSGLRALVRSDPAPRRRRLGLAASARPDELAGAAAVRLQHPALRDDLREHPLPNPLRWPARRLRGAAAGRAGGAAGQPGRVDPRRPHWASPAEPERGPVVSIAATELVVTWLYVLLVAAGLVSIGAWAIRQAWLDT